jgi:hypothetical protein
MAEVVITLDQAAFEAALETYKARVLEQVTVYIEAIAYSVRESVVRSIATTVDGQPVTVTLKVAE